MLLISHFCCLNEAFIKPLSSYLTFFFFFFKMLKYTLFDTFLSPLLLATFKILIKQVKYPKTEKLSLLYQEMCVFSYLPTKTYYN